MKRLHCVGCGEIIGKSAIHDAYVCRTCEKRDVPQYKWLDAQSSLTTTIPQVRKCLWDLF